MRPPRRKKLIEVAMPLEAINKESAREKMPGIGAHPRGLHLWWARRPLAACRAVLFAQLVDDPDSDPQFAGDPELAGAKRAELFNLIEELVKWENSNNPAVINRARAEIARCVASRKIETGDLKKEDTIADGATAYDLVLRRAKPEVVNHFLATHAPPVLDPFAGGGSIPLEAQRLGLRAHASDLNPVPVLINKALIEIPPKFAGMPPVNTGSDAQDKLTSATYRGAQGLAEDVRYYGQWMRDEAEKRIGHLYPKVKITKEMVTSGDRPDLKPYEGQELTVIAWLWARTVPSPDPSLGGKHVPLVRSFWLSKKKGKEAYVQPVIDKAKGEYEFCVRIGTPKDGFDPDEGTVKRSGGRCLVSGSPMPFPHIRSEGMAGRMSQRLMAIVCEGTRGRIYLEPQTLHQQIAESADAPWRPQGTLPVKHRDFKTPAYGMPDLGDLFTDRQLTALTTFSDLVMEARERVLADAQAAFSAASAHTDDDSTSRNASGRPAHAVGNPAHAVGSPARAAGRSPNTSGASPSPVGSPANAVGSSPDAAGSSAKGAGKPAHGVGSPAMDMGKPANPALTSHSASLTPSPEDYADAVATYLAFGVDRCADFNCNLARWVQSNEKVMNLFARQAIPMVWDFAEANIIENVVGGFQTCLEYQSHCLESVSISGAGAGRSYQADAGDWCSQNEGVIVSTDPPYYDNIGYADLSDFFYVWLRRSLKDVYPHLLSTMLTPKAEEMIASPYRHGGSKAKAAAFFEVGLGSAIGQWRKHGCPDFPTTIFYAFKQAETTTSGTASTGWETFLTGVIDHGFAITATLPMRSEQSERIVAAGTNALASSVVLACVPREADASMATRREFLNALKQELPGAMKKLQSGNIAPVDLAQAAIGPGMAVFSRYSKVVESDGESMTVRTALTLINQVLDEMLAEQEGEFDGDTRWAVAWFEQHGVQEGAFGDADNLSRAKNTSVQGLVEAGVITARSGKVKLLSRDEMPDDWDPTTDKRATCWEATQHLIRRLQNDGEEAAAALLSRLGSDYGERARDLAYRLYSICERKKWADEALAYNGLVIAWPEISRLSRSVGEAPKAAEAVGLFES